MSTAAPALRLAATCLPVRDGSDGLQVLMVRRNAELSFGGMWTFPGGTLEDDDGPLPPRPLDEDSVSWSSLDLLQTAAMGAVRETQEETGLICPPSTLSWFSHWIPPRNGPPKRFATWFFLAPEYQGELEVDPSENSEGAWVNPVRALSEHASGDFPLSVPTWVTLDDLRRFVDVASLLDNTITKGARFHHTKAFMVDGGRLLTWTGDAAYDTGDPGREGARNRVLVSSKFEVVERVQA